MKYSALILDVCMAGLAALCAYLSIFAAQSGFRGGAFLEMALASLVSLWLLL